MESVPQGDSKDARLLASLSRKNGVIQWITEHIIITNLMYF